MADEAQTNTNSVVAWVALGFSVIAFVIGVAAFNRAGTDIDTLIGREVEETTEEISLAAARAEARARLIALRARIEAEESAEEIANEVADIRADLANAYERAEAEAQEEFREIDRDLEALESQVREGSADALLTLEGLIAILREEIRYDE